MGRGFRVERLLPDCTSSARVEHFITLTLIEQVMRFLKFCNFFRICITLWINLTLCVCVFSLLQAHIFVTDEFIGQDPGTWPMKGIRTIDNHPRNEANRTWNYRILDRTDEQVHAYHTKGRMGHRVGQAIRALARDQKDYWDIIATSWTSDRGTAYSPTRSLRQGYHRNVFVLCFFLYSLIYITVAIRKERASR